MQQTAFKRIGLTGGIGSGKSTFASLLVDRGFVFIDADAISRQLTGIGGAALSQIRQVFGEDFIAPDGSMDRNKMRALIFAQPQAKDQLQQLLHPLIRAAMADQEAAFKAEGKPLVVLDIPLLVESASWPAQLDGVLVVDCSEDRQIARVMARNGWTRAEVQAVMAAQASRQERLATATWVIDNDSDDIQVLKRQAQTWNPAKVDKYKE
jgi:dephospho-CoA kinase